MKNPTNFQQSGKEDPLSVPIDQLPRYNGEKGPQSLAELKQDPDGEGGLDRSVVSVVALKSPPSLQGGGNPDPSNITQEQEQGSGRPQLVSEKQSALLLANARTEKALNRKSPEPPKALGLEVNQTQIQARSRAPQEGEEGNAVAGPESGVNKGKEEAQLDFEGRRTSRQEFGPELDGNLQPSPLANLKQAKAADTDPNNRRDSVVDLSGRPPPMAQQQSRGTRPPAPQWPEDERDSLLPFAFARGCDGVPILPKLPHEETTFGTHPYNREQILEDQLRLENLDPPPRPGPDANARDALWRLDMFLVRSTHFCQCFIFLFLIYNSMYIYRQWDRVFAFPLGVVLWCNLLTALPYWCFTLGMKGFIDHARQQNTRGQCPERAWKFWYTCWPAFAFLLMLTFILIHDLGFEDTQSMYQRFFLDSIEGKNCVFSSPIKKEYVHEYEMCLAWEGSGEDSECSKHETRYAHEYYSAWMVEYTGTDGSRKKACACTSPWSDKDSEYAEIKFSTIAFHRFADGTLKFPSKSCYYKKDYTDMTTIPTSETCNVKESGSAAPASTTDCFPDSRTGVSIAFDKMRINAWEVFLYQWFIVLHIFAFIIGICPVECLNLCLSKVKQKKIGAYLYLPPCLPKACFRVIYARAIKYYAPYTGSFNSV